MSNNKWTQKIHISLARIKKFTELQYNEQFWLVIRMWAQQVLISAFTCLSQTLRNIWFHRPTFLYSKEERGNRSVWSSLGCACKEESVDHLGRCGSMNKLSSFLVKKNSFFNLCSQFPTVMTSPNDKTEVRKALFTSPGVDINEKIGKIWC